MPFDAKLHRLASSSPVVPPASFPHRPLLLRCRGEHLVDRTNHLLHTLRQFLHVLVRRGVRSRVRVGLSCFVNSRHLQTLRSLYEKHFPSCVLQLSGGDTVHVLHRMERGDLDCALLQPPIEGPRRMVEQIASAPVVVCMRSDDVLADRAELSLQELAQRLTVFRDPDAHPLAHTKPVRLLKSLAFGSFSGGVAFDNLGLVAAFLLGGVLELPVMGIPLLQRLCRLLADHPHPAIATFLTSHRSSFATRIGSTGF